MAGFLYFVETDKPSLVAGDVAAFGLSHALSEGHVDCGVCTPNMPTADGKAVSVRGMVLLDPRRHVGPNGERTPAAFDGRYQTWAPMPDHDGKRRWIGFVTEAPPQPDDLVGPDPLEGYLFLDDVGREWVIPLVCSPDGPRRVNRLPSYLGLDATGQLTTVAPVLRYGVLWDAVDRLWPVLTETGEAPDAEAWGPACVLMAANYVLGPAEISLLRVFSTHERCRPWRAIALATGYFDFVRWRESQRSDPPASPAETPGSSTSS